MVFIKNSLPKHQKCIHYNQYCSFVSFRSLSGYLNNDSHAYLNISSLHLNAAKFTKKNLQNCLWQRSITSKSCSNPHRRPNQRRRKGPPLQEKIIHSNNNNNRPSNGHVRPPVQVGWRQICARSVIPTRKLWRGWPEITWTTDPFEQERNEETLAILGGLLLVLQAVTAKSLAAFPEGRCRCRFRWLCLSGQSFWLFFFAPLFREHSRNWKLSASCSDLAVSRQDLSITARLRNYSPGGWASHDRPKSCLLNLISSTPPTFFLDTSEPTFACLLWGGFISERLGQNVVCGSNNPVVRSIDCYIKVM